MTLQADMIKNIKKLDTEIGLSNDCYFSLAKKSNTHKEIRQWLVNQTGYGCQLLKR